jgi:hypothetical protein
MQQLSMHQRTLNDLHHRSIGHSVAAAAPGALRPLPNSSGNSVQQQFCRASSNTRCQAQQNGNGNWRSNLFNRSGDSASSNGSRSSSPLGSVLGSVDEAELLQQQAAAFQQAFNDGTLSFGFSAGGLLFPVSRVVLAWDGSRGGGCTCGGLQLLH